MAGFFDDVQPPGARSAAGVFDAVQPRPGAPVSNQGNLSRGISTALGQTGPIAKGAVGLLGATMENMVGAGGVATAFKDWGFDGYQAGLEKLAPLQRENDSLTTAWQNAKDEGSLSPLIDFAAYGLGYSLGQLGESAAMAVLGAGAGTLAGGAIAGPAAPVAGAAAGVVAKGALREAATKLIEGQVAKRAAAMVAEEASAKGLKLTAQQATELAASDAVRREATKAVARNIGMTTGVMGLAGTQEGGSIYGEARQEADEQGRELGGADLARIWGATAVATALEGGTELLKLGALRGKVTIPGVGGRAARGLIGGATVGAAEGLTEAAQTVAERFGAGKSLNDSEAWKDYIDSAGLGAIGGAAVGGVSGAFHAPAAQAKAEQREAQIKAERAAAQAATTQAAADIMAAPTVQDAISKAQQTIDQALVEQGPRLPRSLETAEQAMQRVARQRELEAAQRTVNAAPALEPLDAAQTRVAADQARVQGNIDADSKANQPTESLREARQRIQTAQDAAAQALRDSTAGPTNRQALDADKATRAEVGKRAGQGGPLEYLDDAPDIETPAYLRTNKGPRPLARPDAVAPAGTTAMLPDNGYVVRGNSNRPEPAPGPSPSALAGSPAIARDMEQLRTAGPAEFDRQELARQRQQEVNRRANLKDTGQRHRYPDGLGPLTPLQAKQRLAVLRGEAQAAGIPPATLVVTKHPTAKMVEDDMGRDVPAMIVMQMANTPLRKTGPARAERTDNGQALTGEEQQRLDGKSAFKGPVGELRRQRNQQRWLAVDRILRTIEERGGVASPIEAEILKDAGAGKPYDRIDPALGPQLQITDKARETFARTAMAQGSPAGTPEAPGPSSPAWARDMPSIVLPDGPMARGGNLAMPEGPATPEGPPQALGSEGVPSGWPGGTDPPVRRGSQALPGRPAAPVDIPLDTPPAPPPAAPAPPPAAPAPPPAAPAPQGPLRSRLNLNTHNLELQTAVRAAVKSGNAKGVRGVFAVLAKSTNPVIAYLGERLGKGIDPDYKFVPYRGERGLYGQHTRLPVGQLIIQPKDPAKGYQGFEDDEHVVAHELLHAMTVNNYHKPKTAEQRMAKRELQALARKAKEVLGNEKDPDTRGHVGSRWYGVAGDNIDTLSKEFMAEVFTNPSFQARLAEIPYGDETLWTKFVKAVAKLLGLENSSMLTEALRLTEALSSTPALRPERANPREQRGPVPSEGAYIPADEQTQEDPQRADRRPEAQQGRAAVPGGPGLAPEATGAAEPGTAYGAGIPTGEVTEDDTDTARDTGPGPQPGGPGAAADAYLRGQSGRVPGGRRVVGLGITQQRERTGHAALVGATVTSAADLAEAAQAYRDPTQETFRVFFVKGNTVVHATGISSRAPGSTGFMPSGWDMDRYAGWLRDTLRSTGADSYYLLHNHPSGNPTPSNADVRMTREVARQVPGMRAHVVVNSNRYAVIERTEDGDTDETVFTRYFGEDKLLQASKPMSVLGRAVTKPDDLAMVGKSLQREGYITLMGLDVASKVRAVMEVPSETLRRSDRYLIALARRFGRMSGSGRLVAIGSDADINSRAITDAVARGVLVDALPETGRSLSERVMPRPRLDTTGAPREAVADPLANDYAGLEGHQVNGRDAAQTLRDMDKQIETLRALAECLG